MRVITNGDTARIVVEERVSGHEQVGEVVAGVRDCADAGVEELVTAAMRPSARFNEIIDGI